MWPWRQTGCQWRQAEAVTYRPTPAALRAVLRSFSVFRHSQGDTGAASSPQPAAVPAGVGLEPAELVAVVELGGALGHSREARYEGSPEVGRPQDGQMPNRLARWFLELARNASAALAKSCFRPSRVSPPPCVASAFGKLPRLLDTQPLDLIGVLPPKRRHHRRHDNRRDYPTHTSPQHDARATRPA